MEKRFVVPASTMIAGLVAFAAWLLLRRAGVTPQVDVAAAVAVGALVVYSGLRCRRAGGPRLGGVVRAVFLAAMSAAAFVWIGPIPGGVLAVAALAALSMARP